ncbi:hypothetical protein [Bradyrhizobium sp. S3.2.12]|uniref:hypothetical protein n=1 Tax=Bradyrhizobium sp. S3.2.12 TaxID=3156387 RepID=UPI0033984A90
MNVVPQTQRISVLRISLSSFSPRARLAATSARQSRSWRHSAKAVSEMVSRSSDHAASKASRGFEGGGYATGQGDPVVLVTSIVQAKGRFGSFQGIKLRR